MGVDIYYFYHGFEGHHIRIHNILRTKTSSIIYEYYIEIREEWDDKGGDD